MEQWGEHTSADPLWMPSARIDARTEVNCLLKDIEVLRHLLALHGENYDSRGKSVFSQAVESVIEERLMQLKRLVGGSAIAHHPYPVGPGAVTEV